MSHHRLPSRLMLAFAVYAGWIVITLFGGRLMASGQPRPLIEGISHGIAWNILGAALFVLAAARAFGWKDMRFGPPVPWSSLRIMWLPALYVCAFLLASTVLGPVPAGVTVFLFVNTLFVGLSEETMFRGALFQALRTRFALWPAIIATSLLFGSVHILNMFSTGQVAAAVVQAVAAAMSGTMFMAILLRTGSIWPAIIYHALWDFGTFMMSSHQVQMAGKEMQGPSAFLLPILLVLPQFLYALYLLRNVKNEAPEPPAA